MRKIILTLLFSFLSAACSPAGEPESRDFPFDLYRTVAAENKDGNLLISPDSLAAALELLGLGAAGKTAEEIRAVLGAPPQSQRSDRGKAGLATATAIWLQKDAPIRPEFLDEAKKRFQAEVRNLDFAAEAAKATETINAWVAEKTEGKIPSLYERLDESSRLVLTDAAVFSSRWHTGFAASFEGTFTLAGEKEISTDFMSRLGSFSHREGNDVSILELPYETPGYSMLILLPAAETTLADLEAKLSTKALTEWCDELKAEEVEVRLPKFTLRTETPLETGLQGLGMRSAFSQGADFSGINGLQDLYLSDVKQRIFLRVDESGTEAAATTGAELKPKSMGSKSKSFYATRPFLFVIAEKESKDILFVGRVADPREEKSATETQPETQPEKPAEKPVAETPPATPDPSLSGEGGSFD